MRECEGKEVKVKKTEGDGCVKVREWEGEKVKVKKTERGGGC